MFYEKLAGQILVCIVQIVHVQEYAKIYLCIAAKEGASLKIVLICLLHIKFDEIYVQIKLMIFTRMLRKRVCLENECTLTKLRMYRGTQKNIKTLRSKISINNGITYR